MCAFLICMAPVSKGKLLAAGFVAGATLCFLPSPAQSAASLLDGFGGPKGFGADSVFRNDDSGTGPVSLPFPVNFFGTTYNQYYVNTNGNITFQSVFGTFTPSFFPGAPQPIIAPYWADVDTRESSRAPGSTGNEGLVWYTNPDSKTAVVTWNNVGFFSAINPPSNNFQLVLRGLEGVVGSDGSLGSPGDFSFEFRYNGLTWTTGQASGGDSNGLGGTPAVAGFDSGNGVDFYVIPGSKTASILDLVNTTNVDTPGVWRFTVRNGIPDHGGGTASVPAPLPLLSGAALLGSLRKLRTLSSRLKVS